jgi:hypothetical protein
MLASACIFGERPIFGKKDLILEQRATGGKKATCIKKKENKHVGGKETWCLGRQA